MTEQSKDKYDLAIIGAGISGLTAAALAGKFGLKCCILEKEPNAGGYLAGFNKKGFQFDTAIHWLNQCKKEGMAGKVFSCIGEDSPRIKIMDKIHRFKGDSFDYLLTSNPNELRDQLIQDFPHEEKGIRKYFKATQKIGKGSLKYADLFRTEESMGFVERALFKMKLLEFVMPLIKYIFYSGDKVPKGLSKFFKDKQIQKLYSSEKDLLSCLFPIAWAYNKGYQIPEKGGARVFIQWLLHVNQELGNDIIFNAAVEKINIENNYCDKIEYKTKEQKNFIESKYVISTGDIENLYKNLLPKGTVGEKFVSKLENAILYSSAFTVNIALDCPAEELGINQELISITKDGIKRNDHDSGNPEISAISVLAPSARDKSLTPEGKGLLTLYMPAYIEYENYWQTQKDENGNYIRTDEYNKLKDKVANILIDRVEKTLNIQLKNHIEFTDISTPITYYRYTWNKNGTMMGARPGKENMQAGIAHHKTKVPNLFIAGHWADLGGGVPISVKTAANAVLLVLQKFDKDKFKLLANYMDGKINIDDFNKSILVRKYNNSWKQ